MATKAVEREASNSPGGIRRGDVHVSRIAATAQGELHRTCIEETFGVISFVFIVVCTIPTKSIDNRINLRWRRRCTSRSVFVTATVIQYKVETVDAFRYDLPVIDAGLDLMDDAVPFQ